MRRLLIPLLSFLLVFVVLAFGLYAWHHTRGGESIELLWWFRGGRIEISAGELMINCFLLGAGVGVAASLLTFGARWGAWRREIDSLQRDRRRLGAANRALEAALPVLREKYDRTLGLDVPAPAPPPTVEPPPRLAAAIDEPALEPAGETVAVGALARAEARRRGRRF